MTQKHLPITWRQQKLIDVLQNKSNLSDDELNEIAREISGSAVMDLDRPGASKFITHLQRRRLDTQP